MVFHYVNAWEDKNDKGEDIIVMFGCPQENVNIDKTMFSDYELNNQYVSHPEC